MLAIASTSFDQPSETFIHDHVRSISPGKTILISLGPAGADRFGLPVLSHIENWQPPETIGERVINALRHRWRVHVDSTVQGEGRERTLSFLKTHQPRAVLAEFGPVGCILVGVCREIGVPLFVHFHGYDASQLARDPNHTRQYRRLFRSAGGIIVPSSYLADRLIGIGCPQDKLHVCPYGIDPHRFVPTSLKPGRVLAVGRLVEKKAPHLTIRAFGLIADRIPDARLDIVGDGPLQEQCEELISKLGLEERVTLHGVQTSDAVVALMQESSLFVQHSVIAPDGNTEGLPVAILEAMASGLPVISTRHSGITEVVDDGITGLLVPEHDVSGMAAAIAELLDDPRRSARFGAAGRARVLECFTREQARDRLCAILGLA